MSHTGQCPSCGSRALEDNVRGLIAHSGPAFDRWRRAVAASVGGRLLDETLSGR